MSDIWPILLMSGLGRLGRPSLEQFGTLSLFLIQNYAYETQTQLGWKQLDWFSLALLLHHYVSIPFILYEVIAILKADTVDPLLSGKSHEEEHPPQSLIYCLLCDSLVLKRSYHCWRCGHCTVDFDHHCKFLNCCIAQANYLPFLRLLALYLFYSANLLVHSFKLPSPGYFQQLLQLATAAALLFTLLLLAFHFYLNCKATTTLLFFRPPQPPP